MRRFSISLSLLLAAPVILQADAPPAWVQNGGMDPETYPGSRYLTGYGLSGPAGTVAEQRQEAVAMAREAVAASIRTRVSSEFTSKVTQVDRTMSRFVQNLVRTQADLELEGLDTFLTWREDRKGVTHVLAVLDKVRTLQLLAGNLEREAGTCGRAFEAARMAGDAAGLLQARHQRERIEEALIVTSVLSGGSAPAPACPDLADIDAELHKTYAAQHGLDGNVALAALDLGKGLPRGIRVLMDRVTYADTPFCGTFSAFLEQALAAHLTLLGQVKVLDKAAGRAALQGGGLDGNFAEALHAQAVVRGTCFELNGEVKLNLRATSTAGEDLAASCLTLPMDLLKKAGLKLAPDNLQEAKQALAIAATQVQASNLKVKLALDRGEGGIYRKGDKLYLFLKANLDCYVKVLYQQVDGSKLIIFPNKYHPDARVRKNQLYQIPPDDNSFEWVVQEPFGVEMVKVMASTEPIDVQGAAPDANGLSEVKEDLAGLLGRTRGIALRKADAQYAEDTAVVNTLPGPGAGTAMRDLFGCGPRTACNWGDSSNIQLALLPYP